jgi:hypothetical protein
MISKMAIRSANTKDARSTHRVDSQKMALADFAIHISLMEWSTSARFYAKHAESSVHLSHSSDFAAHAGVPIAYQRMQ